MAEKRLSPPVKIRQIYIRNYKGIEELEIEFPPPTMLGDPDITIMGSQNGLGKTSVLECCSLLLIALNMQETMFQLRNMNSTIDIPDLLIKAGEHFAEISGNIIIGENTVTVRLRIDKKGIVRISTDTQFDISSDQDEPDRKISTIMKAVCGFTSNPVIANHFLLFHSYRKVQEGNPELGQMIQRNRVSAGPRFVARREYPMSEFKIQILNSMMGKANLFELIDDRDHDSTIDMLNELVSYYAGGTITKLRPSADNTVDFRVKPYNSDETFTFDGLSSGQKEIISTLFLVWHNTKNKPSVVFIDEPELHLNVQWHRRLIRDIVRLAPNNQYILATHSEDIMDSVNEDRRILLINKNEATQ